MNGDDRWAGIVLRTQRNFGKYGCNLYCWGMWWRRMGINFATFLFPFRLCNIWSGNRWLQEPRNWCFLSSFNIFLWFHFLCYISFSGRLLLSFLFLSWLWFYIRDSGLEFLIFSFFFLLEFFFFFVRFRCSFLCLSCFFIFIWPFFLCFFSPIKSGACCLLCFSFFFVTLALLKFSLARETSRYFLIKLNL